MAPCVVLKWQHFSSNLSEAVQDLRNWRFFTDLTMIAEGRQMTVHKFVLASSSSFFLNVLSKNPDIPLIYLSRIKFQDLAALLDFMYTGETKIEESRIHDFLNAAQEFGVKGLAEDMKELSETLQHQCSRSNENTFVDTRAPDVANVTFQEVVAERRNADCMETLSSMNMFDSSADQVGGGGEQVLPDQQPHNEHQDPIGQAFDDLPEPLATSERSGGVSYSAAALSDEPDKMDYVDELLDSRSDCGEHAAEGNGDAKILEPFDDTGAGLDTRYETVGPDNTAEAAEREEGPGWEEEHQQPDPIATVEVEDDRTRQTLPATPVVDQSTRKRREERKRKSPPKKRVTRTKDIQRNERSIQGTLVGAVGRRKTPSTSTPRASPAKNLSAKRAKSLPRPSSQQTTVLRSPAKKTNALPLWRKRPPPAARQKVPMAPSRRSLQQEGRRPMVTAQADASLDGDWQHIQKNEKIAELSRLFVVQKREDHQCKLCSSSFRSQEEGWLHVAKSHLKGRLSL